MGKKDAEKPAKISGWFRGLKAEFNKITWPNKDSLVKESVAVILIAIVIGCVIAVVDTGLHEGLLKLAELAQQLVS